MKKLITFSTLILTATLVFVFSSEVRASDGFIDLRSPIRESVRCHVTSVRMSNLEFRMPYICWDIIYPIDEAISDYVMWAMPSAGGNPINLGTLAFGRGEFKTKTPFSSLYVTVEANAKTKTPSKNVVLRGVVEEFPLGKEGKPTPTPTVAPKEGEASSQITPSQPQTTREKLVTAFKRAGLAAVIALVGLIGLIFVITRSRG